MRLLSRHILVRTLGEAWAFVAVCTAIGAALAAGAGALAGALLGQPALAQAAICLVVAVLVIPAMTAPVAGAALLAHEREIEQRRQARTDALTGLLNRRGLFEAGEAMFAGSARMSAVLVDLDDFRALNEAYGKAACDEALRSAAGALVGMIEADAGVAGRLGVNKFCALLPDASGIGALLVADRLRKRLATLILHVEDGRVLRAAASVGVASRAAGEASLDALLVRADAALQESRMASRVAIEPWPIRAVAGGR